MIAANPTGRGDFPYHERIKPLVMADQIAIVDDSRCSGCGRCIAACQLRLFAFEQIGWRKVAVLQDSARCNGCGACADMCAIGAVAMQPASEPPSP